MFFQNLVHMSNPWLEEVRLITGTRRSRTLGAFELAPLIDVILMLVIFSLMVTGFIYQPGIQIDLPAVSDPDAIKGRTLNLTVTREEQVYIGSDQTPVALREAISARLISFYRLNPEGVVLIKADYNVRHGYLVELMELIRDSGLRKISFAGILDREVFPTDATDQTPD
jgi:biopolymer transport protein ExbD